MYCSMVRVMRLSVDGTHAPSRREDASKESCQHPLCLLMASATGMSADTVGIADALVSTHCDQRVSDQ